MFSAIISDCISGICGIKLVFIFPLIPQIKPQIFAELILFQLLKNPIFV